MPLPLNEWAKLDIATEKGAIVPAYIRFTSFTRDTGEIEKHMEWYFKANDMGSTFSSKPKIASDEYVLMLYDITVGKDTSLEKGDHILPVSVRFPLQLYSTMRSGNFGDTAAQEREDMVKDVSVIDTDKLLEFEPQKGRYGEGVCYEYYMSSTLWVLVSEKCISIE